MFLGSTLLGSTVVATTTVHRGYTPQIRQLVRLADGRSVFVKQAVDEETTTWLRRERLMYESLTGPFRAAMLGWLDEPVATLILEDLSEAAWPPPWRERTVEQVLSALQAVAAHPPPAVLPRLTNAGDAAAGWPAVADDPSEFLALELCTSSWLDDALPVLMAADAAAPVSGDALLHGDVRSDNLCMRGGSAVLVDWNLAAVGNPLVDIAFWLPSLAAEGGPEPQGFPVAVGPELAAHVAGFFAARAGKPPPPNSAGPRARAVQLEQLRAALPWAAHELGLPPPRWIHP